MGGRASREASHSAGGHASALKERSESRERSRRRRRIATERFRNCMSLTRLRGRVKLYIRDVTNNTEKLVRARRRESVALLKERLGIADGRLIFGTQNLEDHQPLKNYEIAPRSVIEVWPAARASVGAPRLQAPPVLGSLLPAQPRIVAFQNLPSPADNSDKDSLEAIALIPSKCCSPTASDVDDICSTSRETDRSCRPSSSLLSQPYLRTNVNRDEDVMRDVWEAEALGGDILTPPNPNARTARTECPILLEDSSSLSPVAN